VAPPIAHIELISKVCHCRLEEVDHAAIVSFRRNKADKDYVAEKVAEISKPADVYDDNGRKVIAVVMAGVR